MTPLKNCTMVGRPAVLDEISKFQLVLYGLPLLLLIALVLLLAACASSPSTKPDRVDWRQVRLVTDRAAVKSCALLTVVRDDSMDDLKEKVADAGADTALLTGTDGVDVKVIFTVSRVKQTAEAYRCRP